MHEVGHTLGLRHNFKASSWKDLKDIERQVEGAGRSDRRQRDGLQSAQHFAQRHRAGLLLHADDRPLRLLGDRVRLQGILGERSDGTGQDRRPLHRAGSAIRDRRRRRSSAAIRWSTCSTWVTTR